MNDLVKRLTDAAGAYPLSAFAELEDEDRENYGDVVERASASMGRHFSPLFTEAAEKLDKMREVVERLAGNLASLGYDDGGTCMLCEDGKKGSHNYEGGCVIELAEQLQAKGGAE